MRALNEAGAFANANRPTLARAVDVPDIELYAIDASFDAHPSAAERDYLNEMPTSWVLSVEQVDLPGWLAEHDMLGPAGRPDGVHLADDVNTRFVEERAVPALIELSPPAGE